MECPDCAAATRVLESRPAEGGAAVRRRRQCSGCGRRFTTFERVEATRLYVRKRNGGREAFDRGKLRAALLGAAHKRDVSAADVERIVDGVERAARAAGGLIGADEVGERCLAGLREIDYGAYLQFAGTMPSPNAEFAEPAASGSVRPRREHAELPPKTG